MTQLLLGMHCQRHRFELQQLLGEYRNFLAALQQRLSSSFEEVKIPDETWASRNKSLISSMNESVCCVADRVLRAWTMSFIHMVTTICLSLIKQR